VQADRLQLRTGFLGRSERRRERVGECAVRARIREVRTVRPHAVGVLHCLRAGRSRVHWSRRGSTAAECDGADSERREEAGGRHHAPPYAAPGDTNVTASCRAPPTGTRATPTSPDASSTPAQAEQNRHPLLTRAAVTQRSSWEPGTAGIGHTAATRRFSRDACATTNADLDWMASSVSQTARSVHPARADVARAAGRSSRAGRRLAFAISRSKRRRATPVG